MTLLRPCSTSAGFTATPEPVRPLDMAALAIALRSAGFAIVIDAKVILIVQKDGVESSLYDYGKILIKTSDKPLAQAAVDALEPVLARCRR